MSLALPAAAGLAIGFAARGDAAMGWIGALLALTALLVAIAQQTLP